MWKFWYELTDAQKRQAWDLDGVIRQYPSEFEYKVENGQVVDYEPIIK